MSSSIFRYGRQRVVRSSRPGFRASQGQTINCPMPHCDCVVHPSTAHDGTVEYRCFVGGHGRVAICVDGKIELTTRMVIGPQPQIMRERIFCQSPGCRKKRRATCGRVLCQPHCVLDEAPCGCADHDRARILERLHRPAAPAPRLDQLAVPRPRSPPLAPHRLVARAAHVEIPAHVEISVAFTDKDFHTKARVPRVGAGLDLGSLPAAAYEKLHLQEAEPGSMEYLDLDGYWNSHLGGLIPYFHDEGDDEAVYVYLHVTTHRQLTAFPASHYVDMANRLAAYHDFTQNQQSPMSEDDAFSALFDVPPTAEDLEALDACLKVIEHSPAQLRQQYLRAGRTAFGTWADFVRDAERDHETPAEWRDVFRSPLVRRRIRRPTDGPEPSPLANRGRQHSPTVSSGSSPLHFSVTPSPPRPAWRGPPASAAGPSRPTRGEKERIETEFFG